MRKVIVVVGPTAIGKTKIAVEIAKKYNLDVISGDSVSVHKDLNIGSAKPTVMEMDGVKHHLIDILDADISYSAYDFQKAAREIMDKNDLSLIAGGTGFYIQSAIFNYEFEATGHDLLFEKNYEDISNEKLFAELLEIDPNVCLDSINVNNRRRVLRALEIAKEKGGFSKYNKKSEKLYDYLIVYLNIDDREKLYKRINDRVDLMIKDGLIDEVKSLYDKKIYPKAIGYQEFIPYFEGKETLESVIEQIKKNTRHLAKRQITWFKNQMSTNFYEVKENLKETLIEIYADIDKFILKGMTE